MPCFLETVVRHQDGEIHIRSDRGAVVFSSSSHAAWFSTWIEGGVLDGQRVNFKAANVFDFTASDCLILVAQHGETVKRVVDSLLAPVETA